MVRNAYSDPVGDLVFLGFFVNLLRLFIVHVPVRARMLLSSSGLDRWFRCGSTSRNETVAVADFAPF